MLLTNCSLLPDAFSPIVERGFVCLDNGVITDLGPVARAPASFHGEVVDCRGKLLMPGLINGHNHCAMTLFRGLADDLELTAWLHEHIFPAEAAVVNPEMVSLCTSLAAAEMIRAGTTTVADAYFFSTSSATALRAAGMRAVVGHGIVDFPAPSVPDPRNNITAVATFIDSWQGVDARITPAVFAHAPYTCSPRTLRRAKRLADDRGVRFFIHLAESRREQEMIIEAAGPSPVKHLAALDLLDENSVLIHAIWLDDEDLDLVAQSGARVISCPQSNLKLAAGIARIPEMVRRGISVGLGTDGCASNNSLDMFREMACLAKVQKLVEKEPTAMPARQVLAMATTGNGANLGLPHLGRLAPGSPADLILINREAPHLTPFPSSDLLVYAASGSDVDSVMIDGSWVMRSGNLVTLDTATICREIRELAKNLTAH